MAIYITNIDLSKEQHLFIDRFGIVWRETKIERTTVGRAKEIKDLSELEKLIKEEKDIENK